MHILNEIKIFFLVVFVLFFVKLKSQDTKVSGGMGALEIGASYINTSPLHEFLPNDFPDFSKSFLVSGGAGIIIINNIAFGVRTFGVNEQKIKSSDYITQFSTNTTFLNFAYTVNINNFLLIPLIGIGGGNTKFNISKKQKIDKNMIKSNPGYEVNLLARHFDLDLSVQLMYLFAKKEEGGGGLLTGLRMGYNYAFATNRWEFGGGQVTNAPTFGPSAFYIQIHLGIGSISL